MPDLKSVKIKLVRGKIIKFAELEKLYEKLVF